MRFYFLFSNLIPFYNYADARLKFVYVRPAIDNDYEKRVKYNIRWKIQVFYQPINIHKIKNFSIIMHNYA